MTLNDVNANVPLDTAPPHGGILINRMLRGELRQAVQERGQKLFKLELNAMNLSDLELIAVGAMSPLTGFMGEADYNRVVGEMRLSNGLVWSIPVSLAVSMETAEAIASGQEIALCEKGNVLAVMEVAEKYTYDKAREAQLVYGTTEEVHPGVARLYRQGDVLLGGEIWVVELPAAANIEFPELRHTPAQARRMFARRGWRRVVGFQTRNPIHRAHEYIQKAALEIVDGLFLHPLVGETKADDIPADVRIASYQAILRDYYPADSVLLGVFPAAMRYAGPREAIFHAIIRKNYGCTHFIVGRDHAGVGKYYGTYDAQRIFNNFKKEEIGIEILPFDYTFYCKKCGMVVSAKTCPHDQENWVFLSGSQVRQMLERGEMLPEEFTRPEVSKVLIDGMRARKQQPPEDEG
ncbi:MAG: sulfate adenylyltransferase [Chloroflexi bacterium]|nr:sulfate adenylyltransferase [Chloroflexota bacterium]MCI0580105.1 sulfate adenylyltransferase [Chloroflexota bacterium]MCI0649319.1 sulfate adenylyltransferase [Chloroflexota bacterium]MCI0725948.1 sulfate adenylyltransferase [Chloroflexota bacterium]